MLNSKIITLGDSVAHFLAYFSLQSYSGQRFGRILYFQVIVSSPERWMIIHQWSIRMIVEIKIKIEDSYKSTIDKRADSYWI